LLLPVAACNQPEVEISSTPDVKDQPEQTASLDGVTGEPGNSCHKGAADAVISEARAAAAAEQPAAVDGDEQATKRRLETLLQLETRARRTIEENFRRVKGFGFNFLFVDLHFSTHVGHGYIIIPPPIAVAECCGERVCLLSVRPRTYLRNYTSDLQQIFVHITCGRVSRSSSGDVAVLPFLWVTHDGPQEGMFQTASDVLRR